MITSEEHEENFTRINMLINNLQRDFTLDLGNLDDLWKIRSYIIRCNKEKIEDNFMLDNEKVNKMLSEY